uniref:Uncharacterized protein n=1 Tax=Candidatus Kentrum eta TaxID=2126337 RepID=A0A450UG54_9GAMM|nr:MAG: hypothetical protein BECKH772A_GA0070896_100326 [Candidatus Kentron sp. H]VFJ92610.1 MAG: hypothetical protein BECKH772B_GA0070898_1003129 [Candidatus Kentron sp. H]VFJ99337.1 MAG: hypothetical protein BECKH772C_GA0070978_100317 [Candidatus Kentron sp. H]
MDWKLLSLLGTVIVAFSGWFVVHVLNASRDRRNKRREIRVKYLIEAYRNLESASNRGPIHGTSFGSRSESAIADIQLLGTEGQIRMAKEVATAIAEKHANSDVIRALLMSLRDELRKELDLGEINEKPIHLRFESGDQKNKSDVRNEPYR